MNNSFHKQVPAAFSDLCFLRQDADSYALGSQLWHLKWYKANISICFDYIGRIISNIQSNIVKYADKNSPVIISSKLTEHDFSIVIENRLNMQANKSASTGIGLKNINSMMQKMDGVCLVDTLDDRYITTLRFTQWL